MTRRLVHGALATSLALAAGCSALRRGSSAPRLDEVRPDSVVMSPGAVVEVLVRGRDFEAGAPGRNTVHFGDLAIPNVPANADGTQIRLVVPDRMPLRGDAAPVPLESGPYRIRVETAKGVSNVVIVRVFR